MESDREIRQELKRREEAAKRVLEEQIVDALQRDIQKWWESYGESQCIIHEAIPRLYKARRVRVEVSDMKKNMMEKTLSGLYKKRLARQREEQQEEEKKREIE